VKEKVFIYYILFLIYFSFGTYTYFFTNVFFKHASPIGAYVLLVLDRALGIPLFVQFLRHFLKVRNAFPFWDRLLKVISILSPLAFIARFFIEPHLSWKLSGIAYTTSRFLFDTGLCMILLTLVFYKNSKDRLNRFLIKSAFPAALFWAVGFTTIDLYDFLNQHYNVASPILVNWVNSNFDIINIASVMWLAISFSWVLVLRFIQLRKENAKQALDKERLAKEKEMERRQLIELQKVELEKTVEERTFELKHSLENLKSTQSQLIQSEKMASLGELTAGIAHEIQNPLNFVNNFSDVNKELLIEMKEEIKKGNINEVGSIADDIITNEEKINHHGKRADAIVKGMLQHSRSSTGVKESTDINSLADEYLRLAYHGLRAKDKSFNAKMKTDFDESIGKINIIPQDIGRVLLNLYNNAFYAVSEKKKSTGAGYEPTISVSTKKTDSKITISVKDNGNGIPQKVIDKIFQPFFTTKPTGQGTGLGLSLSYDIVKAHGGEIRLETKEGEGSEFVIQLPVV
jgi:signal transduction histidine kinase